jgi:hypothetical protein
LTRNNSGGTQKAKYHFAKEFRWMEYYNRIWVRSTYEPAAKNGGFCLRWLIIARNRSRSPTVRGGHRQNLPANQFISILGTIAMHGNNLGSSTAFLREAAMTAILLARFGLAFLGAFLGPCWRRLRARKPPVCRVHCGGSPLRSDACGLPFLLFALALAVWRRVD